VGTRTVGVKNWGRQNTLHKLRCGKQPRASKFTRRIEKGRKEAGAKRKKGRVTPIKVKRNENRKKNKGPRTTSPKSNPGGAGEDYCQIPVLGGLTGQQDREAINSCSYPGWG